MSLLKKECSPREQLREWQKIGDSALPDVMERAALHQRLFKENNETLQAIANEKEWQEGAEKERIQQEEDAAAERLFQAERHEEWLAQLRVKEALAYITRPRFADRYRFVHDFLKSNIVPKLADVYPTGGSPQHRLACMSHRAQLLKEAIDLGLLPLDDDDIANKVTALYKTYFADPGFWYVFDIVLQGLPLPFSITYT